MDPRPGVTKNDPAEAGATGAPGGTSGGTASIGGTTIAADPGPPSCVGLAARCGPSNESCCVSPAVAGGTFDRDPNGGSPDAGARATVGDFFLDKYEITVGRFRAFVNAGMGTQYNPPASGAGAHPLIAGSGWDATWNTHLPEDTASLKSAISCHASDFTWTDTPGANEGRPQNCMDWYLALAFCAWDRGRLPTEAEWGYAAAGGSEQRTYPWSSPPTSTTIDDSYTHYCGDFCALKDNVGSRSPKGDGRWGQADLVGSLYEWVLDWYADAYPTPCSNCARLIESPDRPGARVVRGGYSAMGVSSSSASYPEPDIAFATGSRCARSRP
jgi:formylglycine-generating enzyme